MKTQIITNDTFYVDIVRFCEANDIADIDEFVSQCLKSGFFIEKYGLLNDDIESKDFKHNEAIVEVLVDRIVEKIVEVPVDRIVEVIKEVIVYKEVIREVPNGEVRVEVREVIKEVPVVKEVYVLKEIPTSNPELEDAYMEVKSQLGQASAELDKKNKIIQEYRAMFDATRQTARYHKSSNIKIS